MNFHLHHHHHHGQHHDGHHHHQGGGRHGKEEAKEKEIRKGCVAVVVGQGEEEQQRITIPVMYINHPLFVKLLKEAEEEYGFDQKGPINIPCHLDQFRYFQGIIDNDTFLHHHHHLHLHLHHLLCFRV